MIVCENCGRVFSSVPILPLVCTCGKKTSKVASENAWVTIHNRYAAAIESNDWSETVERDWLQYEFAKLVPCGSCGSKWISLSETIDLSTAEAAFKTTWQAHNTVSTAHLDPPKPPITFEQCQALYLQQATMDDCCVAVTSLAPNRLERQTDCLDSWRRAGLTIFAVQSTKEVGELRKIYPQVSTWCIQSESGAPTINVMADIAMTIQRPILLINADIEIRGQQKLIRRAIASGNLIGIRHNYDSQWWINQAEKWGLDVFGITPEVAASLPRLPLRIGRPLWDYWLPYHLKQNGLKINLLSDPLFFHKSHALNWTQADWQAGAEVFCNYYELNTALNWQEYRNELCKV